jgi:hypothetical protein
LRTFEHFCSSLFDLFWKKQNFALILLGKPFVTKLLAGLCSLPFSMPRSSKAPVKRINKKLLKKITAIETEKKTLDERFDKISASSAYKQHEAEIQNLKDAVNAFYNSTRQQLADTQLRLEASEAEKSDEENPKYISIGKKFKLKPSAGIIRSMYSVNYLKVPTKRGNKNSETIFSEQRE